MTTTADLAPLVGQSATLTTLAPLLVAVTILNTKMAYGVPRALISPVAGSGQAWVNLSTLTLKEALP